MAKAKNPHAVALGRLGAKAGASKAGTARMEALTPTERRDLARKAALARWGTKKRQGPLRRQARQVGHGGDSGPGRRPTTDAHTPASQSGEDPVPPSPSPDDPACPSCGKPIRAGNPTVLKFGQTLHLRCWTLTLRGKMSALERNRAAREGSRARQLRAPGEADPPAYQGTKKPRTRAKPASG